VDDPSTYYTPLRMTRPFAPGAVVGGGGGGIAFRAGSAVETSFADSTNVVITAPAGLQDGDLIIIGVALDQGTTLTTSNGFTLVHDLAFSATGTAGVLIKIAAGEGASWTFTGFTSSAIAGVAAAVAYTGVDQATPESGTATEVDISSPTTTPAATAMTPAHDNAMVIGVFCADPGGSPTGTQGSGWTERADFVRAANGHVFLEELLQTTAASVAANMTGTESTFWGVIQLALKPA